MESGKQDSNLRPPAFKAEPLAVSCYVIILYMLYFDKKQEIVRKATGRPLGDDTIGQFGKFQSTLP